MTPAEAQDLGRRWIAAGGSVRPGMVICDFEGGLRVIATAAPGRLYVAGRMALDTWTIEETDWIDLRDPATRGAARAVLEDRCGRVVWIDYEHRKCKEESPCYEVFVDDGDFACSFLGSGETEAEALVSALEAAPVTP